MFTSLKNLFIPMSFHTFDSIKLYKYDSSTLGIESKKLSRFSEISLLPKRGITCEFSVQDIYIDRYIKNRIIFKNDGTDFELFAYDGSRAKIIYNLLIKGFIEVYYDPSEKSYPEAYFSDVYQNIKKEEAVFVYIKTSKQFISVKSYVDRIVHSVDADSFTPREYNY